MADSLARVRDDLRAAPDRVGRTLSPPLTTAGRRLVAAARALAPRDTGAYARQYEADVTAGTHPELAVGSTVDYAEYVEARYDVTARALARVEESLLDDVADAAADALARGR